jgi:hypothetical protein
VGAPPAPLSPSTRALGSLVEPARSERRDGGQLLLLQLLPRLLLLQPAEQQAGVAAQEVGERVRLRRAGRARRAAACAERQRHL